MSTYILAQGHFKYATKEAFDKALDVLDTGGWLKGKFIIGEDGSPISEPDSPDVNVESLEIRIPFAGHRNLGYVFKELMEGNEGKLVWTCTDGAMQGGVISGEEEKLYDLEEWDKETNPEASPLDPDDPEGYAEDISTIESDFHEAMS